MVVEYLYFIITLIVRSLFRLFTRTDSDREIALLIKENQILKRKVKRPELHDIDRLFYVAIYRNYRNLLDKMIFVKPETVLRWHRKLAARKWTYSKKRPGRPPVSREVRLIVLEMKKANLRWGAKRIKGELQKLGIFHCERTISSILKKYGFDPQPRNPSGSWFQFLRSQGKRLWACDFFTVETALLKRVALQILSHPKNSKIFSVLQKS